MNKILVSVIFILLLVPTMVLGSDSTLDKPGKIIWNRPAFKQMAVLMQDTTSVFNRTAHSFEWDGQSSRTESELDKLFPALIIDSSLFYYCEKKLLHPDSTVRFYFTNVRMNSQEIKRVVKWIKRDAIRLYIGYIDLKGRRKVIIQFVTKKEFYAPDGFGYDKNLFLVIGGDQPKMAVIKIDD